MPDAAFWRGKRVLLTGHTGFKGSWMALWLAELGAEVHGFSGPPPSAPSLFELARVEEALASSRTGDIRDAAAVREAVTAARADVVIHMAAQPIVRRSLVAPAETFAINVTGTANLLEALAEQPPSHVLVVTSDKCYRDVESGRPMREDDALGGKDPYSASKAAQEVVAASLAQTVLDGVPVATARAGNVIGGGDWAPDRLVPDLFRAALAGEPLIVRNPQAVRPWQHVLNPLSGYLAICEQGAGGAWNLGPDPEDEQPVSWIVERLRERWPEPLEVRVEPSPDAVKEAAVLRLDSTKAREGLGWTPQWTLSAGLDATVEWFDAYRGAADMAALTREQLRSYSA